MNVMMLMSYYSEPVCKMVELRIHRIKEFVQDQIVERNFVDVYRMKLMNQWMKKTKMIMVMELKYYYYP